MVEKVFAFGIQSKMLRIVTSLYNAICCVKYKVYLIYYFCDEAGLLQGETLLPILFSLDVNDFETRFISYNCPSINLQMLNVFVIIYAGDDMVISTESTMLSF